MHKIYLLQAITIIITINTINTLLGYNFLKLQTIINKKCIKKFCFFYLNK